MPKKVLVTGASGFTGGHLANALAERGYDVRVLVRDTSTTEALNLTNIEVVRGDLRVSDDVDRAIAGVEHVYHVAALYRAAKYPDSVYWDVNVGGTMHVLDAVRRHGVQRVVHCSTIGVHGGVKDIPADEDCGFAPGDVYQVTKLEGEKLARKEFARGLPGVVVRPAGIYGPGDLRFLKLFSMVAKRRFIMFGSGDTLLHVVYIDDLVTGMILCGEHPDAIGQTYILAGERYVSLNELVELVAQATDSTPPRRRLPLWPLMAAATMCEGLCRPFGLEPPLHRRRAAFFTKNRAFSIEKARREIGYAPQVDLETGLRRTAAWYLSRNLLA